MEEIVIQALKNVIQSAKDYEFFIRQCFSKLKEIDKEVLIDMKKENPKIEELLSEFETIYNRINEEI